MPEDRLIEFSLRRAISSPRLSSYKPYRFNAGSEKGGQFAPKGMGTVAYGSITKALVGSPGDERQTVWSGGPMKIVTRVDAPASRPDWKPSMTRGEAEQWRAGNVLVGMDAGTDEFYHGTSDQAKKSIEEGGFDLSEVAFGRLWGDGVYLTPEFNEAHHYARENPMNDYSGKETFQSGVVTVFPRVTNPAVLDMTSDRWKTSWEEAHADEDSPFASWRGTVISFFDLWDEFEAASASDGIERSGSFMQWVTRVLKERGHDALVINGADSVNGRTNSMAVIFDPKDVVAIKNAKPPKWFRDRHGLTESALHEGIRRLSLKGYVPKRYAKGTAFGGRFLPKGKSPFAAPRRWRIDPDEVADISRMMGTLRGLDRPNPPDVFPDEVITDRWVTSDDFFDVHELEIQSAVARDIVMGDGRRVRLIVDRDMPLADPDLNMGDRLDQVYERVDWILSEWEGRAPGAPDFPPYITITNKRSPHDADFADAWDQDEFVSDATASNVDKSIVLWNMNELGLEPAGVDSRVLSLFEDRGRWIKLRSEIIDHEMGHVIGVDMGPPDEERWVNAIFEDEVWAQQQGLHDMAYREIPEPGFVPPEVLPRSMGGVTHYAAGYQEETGGFQEDWAESVRLYMKEARTGEPALQLVTLDGMTMSITLKNWSPARWALVHEYMGGNPDDVLEAALSEALGRLTTGKFDIRNAMYLKGAGGKFVGSRSRGRKAVASSRASSTDRARKIAQDRVSLYNPKRGKPLKKSTTLGVTPFRGAGKAQGEDYYETTRFKGFVNDIGRFASEEGVRVEGISRVRGVWRGGGEPSAAVTLFGDDESVQRVMDRLGSKYNQDGVLSFRPSGGGDSFRFHSTEKIDPAALEEAMLDDRFSAIAGATILPDGTVEFVNIGGDPDTNEQIVQLAEALGIEIEYDRGNAGLRLIEEDYPRRTGTSAGSQSSVQEAQVQPGRGLGDLPRQGSGGPSPRGSREDQALEGAIRKIGLPGLRSRAPKRYAKGTVFGGRFLPKGVSPFSASRTVVAPGDGLGTPLDQWRAAQAIDDPTKIGLGPMTRVTSVTGKARLRPFFKMPEHTELLDPGKAVRKWTRIDGFHEMNVDHPSGAFVKDMTLRRGRRVRIVLDADIPVARSESGRDALFQHIERELSVWADKVPRKRFPPSILISAKSYQAMIGDGPNISIEGTSSRRTKRIAIWNVPDQFGRPNRSEIDDLARYAEFNTYVIDHEIAHSSAPKAGPPTPKVWEEAMVRDHKHQTDNGLGQYVIPDWKRERDENGWPRPSIYWDGSEPQAETDQSSLYGITRYASATAEMSITWRRGSPLLHEDWAESVAFFMEQERANGLGGFLVSRDGRFYAVRMEDFAPNRARLIREYLDSGKMTRGEPLYFGVDVTEKGVRRPFDVRNLPPLTKE